MVYLIQFQNMPNHTRINKERIDKEVYRYFVVNGEYPEFKTNKSIFVSDVLIISKSTIKKGAFRLFGKSKYRWATTSGVATTVAKRLDILGKGFIFAKEANATKQVSEPTEQRTHLFDWEDYMHRPPTHPTL